MMPKHSRKSLHGEQKETKKKYHIFVIKGKKKKRQRKRRDLPTGAGEHSLNPPVE